MSTLGTEMLASARARLGEPFAHHYKPINECDYGRFTLNACMERGVGDPGYDCSGLVIASLCDVLGLATRDWPRQLRHTQQMQVLATDVDATPGDVRVYFSASGHIHMGIVTAGRLAIHSSGRSQQIEEAEVTENGKPFLATQIIAIQSLYRAAARGH